MFPNVLSIFLDKIGIVEKEDKGVVADWCICFGVTGLVVTFFVGTEWYILTMCWFAATVVVLGRHYYRKYKRNKDELLYIPSK